VNGGGLKMCYYTFTLIKVYIMKNKIYPYLIAIILFNQSLFSQVFTKAWANNTIGSSMKPLMIKPDPLGYLIMLSEGTTTSANNWVLSKYNSSGVITYSVTTTLPSTLSSGDRRLRVDKFGNVYVVMYINGTGTFDIDPGPGVINVSQGLNFIKYRNDFTPKWAKKILTGAGGQPNFAIDSIGNIFINGPFRNTVDFDPGPGYAGLSATVGSFSSDDVFVAAYDSAGTYLWADRWGAKDPDDFGQIEVNPVTKEVYVFVRLDGENVGEMTDIDPGPGTLSVSANYIGGSNYLIKLNSNGTFSSYIPNVYADATTVDASGNLYLFYPSTGYYYITKLNSSLVGQYTVNPLGANAQGNGTMDIYIDSNYNLFCGASSYHSGGCTNGEDFYMAKINAGNGAVINQITFWGLASTDGCPFQAAGIVTITGNEVILANYHRNVYQMDYDPTAATTMLPSSVSFYGAIAKYNFCATAPSQPASVSGNSTICPNSTNIYTVAPIAGATSYTWTKPGGWSGTSTTNTISLLANSSGGIISVASINACGTSGTTTLQIIIGTPTVTAVSSNSAICMGNSATLTAGGASSYTWQPGNIIATSITVSPLSNTTYTVLGSNGGTCTNTALSNINVNSLPSVSANATSNSICTGGTVALTGSGGSTYSWSGGITDGISFSPTVTLNYTVTGTDINGCSNIAVASVTVNSIPVATANTTQSLTCVNATAILNGSGVSTYTWSGPGIVSGGNTSTPTANMAGTYSLVGTTSGCVSNMATVSLTSNTIAPSVSVTATSNSICIGNSATLTASGASTYSWSTSSTATSIVVSPTTTTNYILTGTNSVNGCTNVINKSIGVNPLPTVSANTSASVICGPPFQGTATLTASGALNYSWNTTATTTAIVVSPSITTVYTVTGTDANGCVNSTSFTQSVSACTGVSTTLNDLEELNLYPNPTTGVVTIKAKSGLQIHVYNVIGELILDTELKTDTIELDLSIQPNGIYFIHVGSVTKKIVKR
jgi:hypothetical protein